VPCVSARDVRKNAAAARDRYRPGIVTAGLIETGSILFVEGISLIVWRRSIRK
jgi:hypothetical protein